MIGLLIGTSIAFYVIMGDLGPAIISRVLGIEVSNSILIFQTIFDRKNNV